MSVLRIPDAHMRALYVCMCVCACMGAGACVCMCVYVCLCVLEMRHRVGRSYNIDQDPYSQKHFIGGSADPGSLIRPLWSIKFQSLLKGKTYRGSAPILCCRSSSTKHIQINKISQSRQWDCSLKFWNCRLGTSSGVEQRGMHFSTGLFTYTSPQAGVGRIQSHRAVCVCGGKVDNHPDFTCHYVLSSLCRQSPTDRTGATTFVCVCRYVSMHF